MSCTVPSQIASTDLPISSTATPSLFSDPPILSPVIDETLPVGATESSLDIDAVLAIDVYGETKPISDYIYGMNFADTTQMTMLGVSINRWGGNATTRYNWKIDTSNRASDWFFENISNLNSSLDNLPDDSSSDIFIEQNRAVDVQTVMTIPLIGWTPRSREFACGFSIKLYGSQEAVDNQHPDCGNGVTTNGLKIVVNNPTDTSIAIDETFVQEWITHLSEKYGVAGQGGVSFYNLDNEPMLWHITHRDVHPKAVGYDEIKDLTYRYASALKAIDPDAKTLGPSEWGWTAYFYSALDSQGEGTWWNNPTDQKAHSDMPFLAWYLQQMQAYEQKNGQRILDYLDVHYYPQADEVALSDAGNTETQELRLRSTRSLWDPEYIDESWINTPIMLIPRLRAWVEQYYPGTKLAISEYNFGGLEDINGALTQAEVLGIFGREGLDLATLWSSPQPDQPGAFAFRMYRNYDGVGGHFGNFSLSASSSDANKISVFAARQGMNGNLTLMVINKTSNPVLAQILLQGFAPTESAQVYQYSSANLSAIQSLPGLSPVSQDWVYNFASESITLLVFK